MFEISIGPKGDKTGFDDYEDASEDESVDGWIASPKHRAVLFNEGIWKDIEWTRIGAAAYGPFANVCLWWYVKILHILLCCSSMVSQPHRNKRSKQLNSLLFPLVYALLYGTPKANKYTLHISVMDSVFQ